MTQQNLHTLNKCHTHNGWNDHTEMKSPITGSNTKHNIGWIDIRQTDRKTNKRIDVLTDKVNEYYYSVTALSRCTNEAKLGLGNLWPINTKLE